MVVGLFHMEAKELRVCDIFWPCKSRLASERDIRDIGLGEIPKFEISWRLGKGTC